MSKERQSSRLDWAESSWIRWIEIPLYTWLTPILRLSNKRTLVDNDLDDVSIKDKCSLLLKKINEDGFEWTGTWNVLIRTFYKDFFLSFLLVIPLVLFHLGQPLFIRYIVLYIKGQLDVPLYGAYLLSVGLFICSLGQSIVPQQIFFRNSRIGMRIRNVLSTVIYKHLLRMNTAALQKTTVAQIINLVANDVSKFEEFSVFVHASLVVPFEALVTFVFLWLYIGLPTLFGYSVLILLIPIQLIFSREFSQYRKSTMLCTDKRVQSINELLNGCQIIKMYNWEKAMEERVHQRRQQELLNISKSSCLRALNMAFSFSTLPLICLATFGGSWLMGRTLLSEDIFSTLAFFVMVRVPITITMPSAIEKLSESRISATRIDQFMKLDKLSNKHDQIPNEDHLITMEDASFAWQDSPSLFSINLKIKNGNFVGVKGTIGSGKSTLLAAILGEINLLSGKSQVNVNSISFAPQIPWIFADTIRANILLGKPMDEIHYENVIKATCLDIDLQNFGEVGDLLIIGDKGVNLSGGQRARISLARALYADADLYLFDDPLAAVDPKVAKHIFEQCIGPRSLLREKTRILITHQTQFLVETDQLFVMTNGHIEQLEIEQQSLIDLSNDLSMNNQTDWTVNTNINDINSIVKDETSIDGTIKSNIWFKLFTAPPLRWFGFLLMMIIMIVNQVLYDFANVWLAFWSDKDKREQRSSFYAYIYLGLICSILILAILRIGYIYYIMLCGSTYFHNRMVKGLLYSSLRFFESNPSGRILNRVSKDQQILDQSLPLVLVDTMQYLLMTVGSITIIGKTNPWLLLILIPLIPSVWWLRRFYMNSSRQLKRLENVTRSPIYTLFSSSLDGLTTIRAFNIQDDFLNMFMERIDTNSRAYFILSASARWFGLRLDFLSSILTLVTSLLAIVLRHQIDSSSAALSITYCITLTGLFQWAIRQSTEAETFMTSAERIDEYGQLIPETEQNNNHNQITIQPAKDWPSHGIIEFKDYTFRYRPQLNPVLKNLNIRIQSNEKIGIIGRTGAGKSSVIQGMFRLVDQSSIEGKILIDGIDIGCLSLDHLRSHLSVIPQVPILFSGTLRYNIDPFEQFSNEECSTALQSVQLKHLVETHPDGLNLFIAESGTNLSAGERQLICIARAILRKNRILLIDEATANVDYVTDRIIQQVINDKFGDRTIITIAHRLNTVSNSDRILMLEKGEVVYFDIPNNIQLT